MRGAPDVGRLARQHPRLGPVEPRAREVGAHEGRAREHRGRERRADALSRSRQRLISTSSTQASDTAFIIEKIIPAAIHPSTPDPPVNSATAATR